MKTITNYLITVCFLTLCQVVYSQDCRPTFKVTDKKGVAPGVFRVNKMDTVNFFISCYPSECELLPEGKNISFKRLTGKGTTGTFTILPSKPGQQKASIYLKCAKGAKAVAKNIVIEPDKKVLFVEYDFTVSN
jgi:hypothetical protein